MSKFNTAPRQTLNNLYRRADQIHLNLGLKKRLNNILKLTTKGKLLDGPTQIMLNPMGYACNHSCIMCWRQKIKDRKEINEIEKNNLTINDYEKIISNLPLSVKVVVVLGGGEPLLYKDILKLCKIIKDNGLEGQLVTNGSLLTEKIADYLREIGWNSIRFSTHAASGEEYEKIHRSRDFNKVVKNIKYVTGKKGNKIKTTLFSAIQKDNYKNIIEFQRLAESLNMDEVEYDTLIPHNPATVLNDEETKETIKFLEEIDKKCIIENNATKVIAKIHTMKLGPKRFEGKKCFNINLDTRILANGDVIPCCFLDKGKFILGNVHDNDFSQIWQGESFINLRQNLENGVFESICLNECTWIPVDRN